MFWLQDYPKSPERLGYKLEDAKMRDSVISALITPQSWNEDKWGKRLSYCVININSA